MLTTVLQTAILVAAMLASCLQAGTLNDIRALEVGKTGRSVPAMDSLSLPENGAVATTDCNVQDTPPVWYSLSDNRKAKVRDWKVVLFMQSTCPYYRQFMPALKAFSQKTGFDVFPISLNGKGDAELPDVLPATPSVMVEYLQSGLPVATPTTFLTSASTIEAWPLLQGAVEAGEFRGRLNKVLRIALNRRSRKGIPLNAQGQQ